jgi:uncharacterized protein (DUF362 family)
MSKKSDEITRRKLLEGASALAGAAAVGPACSSDTNSPQGGSGGGAASDASASGGGPASPSAGGSPSGGSSGMAGATGGVPAAGAGGGKAGSASDAGGSTPTSDSGEPPGASDAMADAGPDRAVPPAMVTVGIVRRPDVDSAVRRAIELAGGLSEIGPGKTVFIKPNAVYNSAGRLAITTSMAVLTTVIKIVKEQSPQRIIVGDRSARQYTTESVFTGLGLASAALAAGADEVYAAPSPQVTPADWVLMKPPFFDETWSAAGGILAMRKIVEADFLINVPVLKNHRYAMYSLAMKAFMGAIGDTSRDAVHFSLTEDPVRNRMGRDIATFNQIFNPLMSIVDGWDALINGGPEGTTASVRAQTRIILASRDRVAVDATAASVLKLELSRATVTTPDQAYASLTAPGAPWNLPQLVAARDLKIGIPGPERAVLTFDSVPDATAIEGIFRS